MSSLSPILAAGERKRTIERQLNRDVRMGSSSNANNSSTLNFGKDDMIRYKETMANIGSRTSTGSTVYAERLAGSRASTSPLSSSSSLKRPGPRHASPGPAQQPIGRCQVEGCGVDLTGAKAYYCKHRVCGAHSKAPRVIVGGIEQRFCQQCSRFHLLSEFDQGKRSCRRRLAGHNERRRKLPSGPLSHARKLSPFFHELDGTGSSGFVMDFTRPSTTVASLSNQPSQVIPNRPQIGSQSFVQTPTHQQILSIPNDTHNLAGATNSNSALSLLSSPVEWSRPTGDSFQGPFSFKHLHEGNSSSPNHDYANASSLRAQQHPGLDMMERPIRKTVQHSGQLGLVLIGNRESFDNDSTRNYEHDGNASGHDLIKWSL